MQAFVRSFSYALIADGGTCQLRWFGLGHSGCVAQAALLHEVPAFEVFADRQPVEWGLTEVIEHSLVSQDDSIDSVVIGWLMS